MTSTTFSPSHYQQDIFDFVSDGRGSAVVDAAPGSGKTTTCVESASYLHTERALFVAFNKHIAEELKSRLPGKMKAQTIHSLGMSALKKRFPKTEIDSRKYSKLIRSFLVNDGLTGTEYEEARDSISELLKLTQLTLTNPHSEMDLRRLVKHYDITVKNWEYTWQNIAPLLEEGRKIASIAIDFDDMVYLPNVLDLSPSKHDFLIVDESQDLNRAQLELVLKAHGSGARGLYVGDKRQCQPAGTMVRLSNGANLPIEQLQPEDNVITYDRRGTAFIKKGIVNAVSSRNYQGYLYTVSTQDKQSKCTDSHKWLVRWQEAAKGKNTWVSYLMRKGSSWRVGVTRLFLSPQCENVGTYNFGLGSRMTAEKADAAWILKVHSNFTEALVYEQITSAKFGLPQVTFKEACGNAGQIKHFSQSNIDSIFEALYPQEESGIRCLTAHGRKIEFPLISKESIRQRRGRATVFETQACNLISGFMAVPVAPDSISNPHFKEYRSQPKWETINVETNWFNGDVYSLDIEKYHKYVADGLVTCNSIMGFAGADSRSIDSIIKRTNSLVLPLSISYRCPTSHIELANEVWPGIEPRPDAPVGTVEHISEDDIAEKAKEGDLIICRCNAPLISCCFALIRSGIPARVRGRDIGRNLIALIKQVAGRFGYTWNSFLDHLRELEREQIQAKQHLEDSDLAVAAVRDRIDTIIAIYQYSRPDSLTDLESEIAGLFSDDRASVWLSTVHKAKGLEADRVFILRPELMPHPMSKKPWEKEAEANIKFVALTRAKRELYFAYGDGRDLEEMTESEATPNRLEEEEEDIEELFEITKRRNLASLRRDEYS